MKRTKTNFIYVQTLAPPVAFMIVSIFHKSCEKQGKQKEEIVSRHCAPRRPQNKTEANFLASNFFHCFNIAGCYSGFCKVSNLSDSVRTASQTEQWGFPRGLLPQPVLFQTANCSLLAGSLYNLPSNKNSLTANHHLPAASQMSTLN